MCVCVCVCVCIISIPGLLPPSPYTLAIYMRDLWTMYTVKEGEDLEDIHHDIECIENLMCTRGTFIIVISDESMAMAH